MSLASWLYAEPIYQQLTILCTAWTLSFFVCRYVLFLKRSAMFSKVVISWLHSVVMLVLGGFAFDWTHPFARIGQRPNHFEVFVLANSLAYFAYDTVVSLILGVDLATNIHHVITDVALYDGVFNKWGGPDVLLFLWLLEGSNPFLHARAILKDYGLNYTKLALGVDIVFAATFFICRLILAPLLLYYSITSHYHAPLIKVIGVLLTFVSLYWAWQIIAVMQHKSKKAKMQAKEL